MRLRWTGADHVDHDGDHDGGDGGDGGEKAVAAVRRVPGTDRVTFHAATVDRC